MEKKKEEGCDTLMHLYPKTDAEKLIWAGVQIKFLVNENKSLVAKIELHNESCEELKTKLKTTETGALILKNQKQKERLAEQEDTIRELKKTNALLLDKVIKLQINN